MSVGKGYGSGGWGGGWHGHFGVILEAGVQ